MDRPATVHASTAPRRQWQEIDDRKGPRELFIVRLTSVEPSFSSARIRRRQSTVATVATVAFRLRLITIV